MIYIGSLISIMVALHTAPLAGDRAGGLVENPIILIQNVINEERSYMNARVDGLGQSCST